MRVIEYDDGDKAVGPSVRTSERPLPRPLLARFERASLLSLPSLRRKSGKGASTYDVHNVFVCVGGVPQEADKTYGGDKPIQPSILLPQPALIHM